MMSEHKGIHINRYAARHRRLLTIALLEFDRAEKEWVAILWAQSRFVGTRREARLDVRGRPRAREAAESALEERHSELIRGLLRQARKLRNLMRMARSVANEAYDGAIVPRALDVLFQEPANDRPMRYLAELLDRRGFELDRSGASVDRIVAKRERATPLEEAEGFGVGSPCVW